VRLHHGDAAGCSYAGRQYPSDGDGYVLVPARAAAELAAHGFLPAPADSSPCRPAPARKPAGPGKLATSQAASRQARG
ncbi:MAG: hypothetical protein ACREEZ_09180, partial [Stellaceae bacterium]